MGFVPDHDHDVFVSYAHIDNEPLAGAADGWVTTLVRNLTTIVRQKLGDREGRLDVWVDDELAGNVPFPAQIEALNRYRSHGEPAITVQNVSVGDGGNAIVGNVTQHARVIVSDKNPASAARKAPKAAGSRRVRDPADAKREAQA